MRKDHFWHALSCLAHPLSVAAIILVALNALVLQKNWPSWWTGKIGDVAWMIFSPFLIASTLILLIPSRWLGNLKRIILAAIFIAGVGFSLLKSVPAINSGVIDAIAGFGLTLKLALDPTDLIALPFLLIAWLVWNQKHVIKPHRIFVLAVIPFSIFATMADMAPAPSYIDCLLVMEDNSVVALSNSTHVPYRSYDGGMIWVEDTSIDEDTSYCRTYISWPVAVHTDPPLSFFYINGEGLYQSSDDGLTLKLETIQPGVTTSIDYAVATAYDTLVISTGNGHFWTRTPGGAWLQFEEKYPELLLEQITR